MATLDEKRKDAILELGNENIQIRIHAVESLIEVANSYATDTALDLKTEERARKINNILGYLCRYIQDSSEQNAEKINDIPVRKKIFESISNQLEEVTENQSGKKSIQGPWGLIECDFSESTINYPLENTTFMNANFSGAKFTEKASLKNSSFFGESIFSNSNFWSTANFDKSHFYGATKFDHAKFKVPPNSKDYHFFIFASHFHEETSFESAEFYGNTIFNNSYFYGYANFNLAQFFAPAQFKWAVFKDYTAFSGAIFKNETTDFSYAKFTQEFSKYRPNFQGAQFGISEESDTNFIGTDFKFAPYFDGASITGSGIFEAYIHDVPEPVQDKKADYAFKFMLLDYRGKHKFDFHELGSYKYVPGEATIVLEDGQPITREIPAGSRLFDPTSRDKRTHKYTCKSDFAKPREDSDAEEEKPTE